MHALRRQKLADLIATRFRGDRGAFLKASGLSKGRLSQLLDEDLPFGDTAARNLEERLHLDPGYFDAMDKRTLRFATMFESLSSDDKEKWERLLAALSGLPPAPDSST